MRAMREFTKGFIRESPVFVMMLGLCPALAITTSVMNGLGMGIAVIFVLTCSNLIISVIKGFIPGQIRIPCFIVVIASFVVIVERVLAAYLPELNRQLGIYIPLIVVNCIILGRAEAHASKNSPYSSLLDGLGMGAGFTISLVIISAIREAAGAGTIMGVQIVPGFKPVTLMILPPGAFLTIGCLLALFNLTKKK